MHSSAGRGRIRGAVLTTIAMMWLTVATAHAQQETADAGAFTVVPNGYVQFDLHAFPGWDVTPGTGRLNRSIAEILRARAGLEGGWRRVSFEVSIDPQDDDGVFVKDAYSTNQGESSAASSRRPVQDSRNPGI